MVRLRGRAHNSPAMHADQRKQGLTGQPIASPSLSHQRKDTTQGSRVGEVGERITEHKVRLRHTVAVITYAILINQQPKHPRQPPPAGTGDGSLC